jgi:hypothetical protein
MVGENEVPQQEDFHREHQVTAQPAHHLTPSHPLPNTILTFANPFFILFGLSTHHFIRLRHWSKLFSMPKPSSHPAPQHLPPLPLVTPAPSFPTISTKHRVSMLLMRTMTKTISWSA